MIRDRSLTRAMVVLLLTCAACGRIGFEPLTDDQVVRGHSEGDDDAASTTPNEPVVADDGGIVSVLADAEDGGASQDDRDSSLPSLPPDDDGGASSEPVPVDAGAPLPVADAGSGPGPAGDAGTTPTPPRECRAGGAEYLGMCWYLSGTGESCIDACRGRGGVDARAPDVIGSDAQGGNVQHCAAIFSALGFRFRVAVGTRSDGLGLGCHRWDDGRLWWLSYPGFDAGASSSAASRVCSCAE